MCEKQEYDQWAGIFFIYHVLEEPKGTFILQIIG